MRYQTILLAVLAAAAAAQQPAEPPAQRFRTGVQAVEVDVRVIGKDGRFVTDLTADDFELLEDGARQHINSVVLIGAPSAPSAPSAPAPPAPPAPSAPSAPSAGAPAVWVFVFDTPHLSTGALQRARDAVVKFIDEKFHDGDLGGVVADGRMVNNRLTSTREELRKAAAGVRITGDSRSAQFELRREWPRLQDEYEAIRIAIDDDSETLKLAVARACSEDPGLCGPNVPVDLIIKEKARRLVREIQRASLTTLSTAEALANGLTRVPGPKTVVFITEGFVIEKLESELQKVVGRANRAGAHFYTIDARGLNRGSAGADIIDQPIAGSTISTGPRVDAQADGPNGLAVDTGAFAIRNQNNFGRALDDIQRDAGTYYVVAYAPTNETFDGKYRTISVKVTRPGVKVRARRGYLALEPSRMLTAAAAPTPVVRPAPPPVPSAVPDLPPETPAAGLLAETPSVGGDGSAVTVPGNTAAVPVPAVRARVDAGKMALALGKDPRTSTDAAQAGWAAYERGDVEKAARELSTAAASPDAQTWVHYVLGMSYQALKRYHDAAQAWERVRQAAPEFEPLYFSLADAYIGQHEETAAIRILRDAERRWPSDPEIQNAIGVILVRRGALDAAIESFERATAMSPSDALGYFNLGRAHQMRLVKRQRYNRQVQRWMGGEDDRRKAIDSYQKYVQLGGPYVQQAKEALSLLGWS